MGRDPSAKSIWQFEIRIVPILIKFEWIKVTIATSVKSFCTFFCSFPDFSAIFDTCRSPPALKLSSCQSQSPDPLTSQCICSPVPHYLPCIPVYTSHFSPVICLIVYPIFALRPLFLFLACLFLTTACIARLPLACLVRPRWLIMCCGILRWPLNKSTIDCF